MKSLPLLYFSVFMSIVGFGMIFPLLPFYAQSFGASPITLSLLVISFSVAQFFVAPMLGRVSDRFGRKIVLAICLLGSSFSFLLFAIASSLAWLFCARVILGLFSAGIFPVSVAYLGDVTSKNERLKFVSKLAATFAVGFIVGPAFSGILSKVFFSFPFIIAAFISFLNAILIFLFLEESLSRKSERLIIREGFVNFKWMARELKGEFGVLLGLLFAWSFAISNLEVAFPLFAGEKFGYSSTQTGYVFAFIGIVAALVQWFALPRISLRVSRRQIITVGIAFMVAGQYLIPLSWVTAMLFVFSGVSTVGSALLRPTISSILSEETKEGQGTTMGLAFSFESGGRIVGPLIGGFLISWIGVRAQFELTSLVLLASLAVFLYFESYGKN